MDSNGMISRRPWMVSLERIAEPRTFSWSSRLRLVENKAQMRSEYQRIGRWEIPRSTVRSTLRPIRRAGRSGNEAGVMWLGTRGPIARVQVVVQLHGAGVI